MSQPVPHKTNTCVGSWSRNVKWDSKMIVEHLYYYSLCSVTLFLTTETRTPYTKPSNKVGPSAEETWLVCVWWTSCDFDNSIYVTTALCNKIVVVVVYVCVIDSQFILCHGVRPGHVCWEKNSKFITWHSSFLLHLTHFPGGSVTSQAQTTGQSGLTTSSAGTTSEYFDLLISYSTNIHVHVWLCVLCLCVLGAEGQKEQLPSTYSYDPTSGFYYDSASGLYYDPKTQVLPYRHWQGRGERVVYFV